MENRRLIDRIKLSGLKYSYIAEQMGVSRTTLYNKLQGFVDWTRREIQCLCDILGVEQPHERELLFFTQEVD